MSTNCPPRRTLVQGSAGKKKRTMLTDPSIHIDDYTCAELYLHLRDTLEERIERAGTEPTGVKSPLAHKRQPTSAQAAMGMTRKALGESLRLARASSRQNLAPGEEPQSVLDCMRDA